MQTYTIREISQLFSLPLSTLRYYEEEGLLTNVTKSASGQRIYTQEHIDRLHCINCFKRTGMTIAQLKKLFEYESDESAHIDDIIALLEEQEAQINEKLQQLQRDSAHVHHKVAHYRAIRQSLQTGAPMPVWEECEADSSACTDISSCISPTYFTQTGQIACTDIETTDLKNCKKHS